MHPTGDVIADPASTARIRERVLRAWEASPARFREDANAEEDYALGGYRDRLVIELAQNAADAAARAGVPGRLRLTLRDAVLEAANTGEPLDAAGVEALTTLRASAKRDESSATGRFGVGFTAVVAVTDEPSIVTRTADGESWGVTWSAVRTRELIAEIPSLAEEIERRGGQVPVLRLPWPAQPPAAPGFATVVRLPLRDAEAEALVRRLLAETGPALMLALPALDEVTIDAEGTLRTITRTAVPAAESGRGDDGAPTGVRLADVVIDGTVWRIAENHGEIGEELLADRPTEERTRPFWNVRWAVPLSDPDGATESLAGGAAGVLALPEGVRPVVHAPTPSDEPLGLPALLIASFPLAPDRRRVAPGPLTDHLIERAAETYAVLLRALPPTPAMLSLVPGPFAEGELDARIRRAIMNLLPGAPLLPATEAGPRRLRGKDAICVDGPPELISLLSEVLSGLLPAGWSAGSQALARLGVRRMGLADVADAVAGLERDPSWWRSLYSALDGGETESLAGLPVPLADGRTVRGPRGLLIAVDGLDARSLGTDGVLGLRFVHPEAVHPLLRRLGANEAGPRAVLTDPATRGAVAASLDEAEPEPIADAVLSLVRAAGLRPDDEPWLAELALPGEDGEIYPAGELLLPSSPLRDLVAADAPFGVAAAELVERYGAEALEAVGVLNGFALVTGHDVDLAALAEGDAGFELDEEEHWARAVLAWAGRDSQAGAMLSELTAVRDLELVADWDKALPLLAGPGFRPAVVRPARLIVGGTAASVPSYTAWWLRRHAVLDGRRPSEFKFAEADLLDGLYDLVPGGVTGTLDREFLLALGIRTSLTELLAEPGGAQDLLDRMADPGRGIERAQLGGLWSALARADVATEPPERVRAVVGDAVEVVPALDAMVLDSPDLLPLLAGQPLIICAYEDAERLAELLDLPTAGEEVPGVLESTGMEAPVPPVVRAILPDAPETYAAHAPLIVDSQSVPWWIEDGTVHASGPAGLARGLAWTRGRWADRLLLEALLRDPGSAPYLLAEAELDA